MIKIVKKFSWALILGFFTSSPLFAATTTVSNGSAQNTQQAISSLQNQIQAVSNNIPVQLQKLQATNQQQILRLQQQMQAQLNQLQQQIQQVQTTLTKQMNILQSEMNQLKSQAK